MAKRMKSKIQPAEQTMTFSTTTIPSGGSADFYVDLSQCASIVNRRFYRQGLNWAVSSIKIISGGFTGSVQVCKLPNSWIMSNAWEKSFRAWQHMVKDALVGGESNKPKFLDFKIYADQDHFTAGVGSNLLPIDSEGSEAEPGEWNYSKIHIPSGELILPQVQGGDATQPEDSVTCYIKAVGGNTFGTTNVVSLIDGYANSRALPHNRTPNNPPDMQDVHGDSPENWIQALYNDGSLQNTDVLTDLDTENNETPYPIVSMADGQGGYYNDTMYPGGGNQLSALSLHDHNSITTTTVGSETISKGGNFPCGLIKFQVTSTADSAHNLVFQIDLVPGSHRGYLAESMMEM